MTINPFIFTRVSATEAHIHFFDWKKDSFLLIDMIIAPKSVINNYERLFYKLDGKLQDQQTFIVIRKLEQSEKVDVQAPTQSIIRSALPEKHLPRRNLAP